MGNDTIIHTDYRYLQFMHTQAKLHNDHHQKWSTYLQKLHLNIKYKKGNTNHVVDYLSRPPVVSLTTILNSYGHETSRWLQLYNSDSDIIVTYQTLSTGKLVLDFHL
jgi:hypothetical protein